MGAPSRIARDRAAASWPARAGLAAMAVLAIGVALYSLRFWAVLLDAWPGVDAGIRGVIVEAPLAALAHMLVAPVALILGPFQFMPRLRLRHPRAHRLAGRTYVGACVIGGVGGAAPPPPPAPRPGGGGGVRPPALLLGGGAPPPSGGAPGGGGGPPPGLLRLRLCVE